MTRLFLIFALTATGFCMQFANAQIRDKGIQSQGILSSDNYVDPEKIAPEELKKLRLEDLKKELEDIPVEEKYKLTIEVERINTLLSDGKITAAEATSQKEKAAKNAALNIDSKTAIVQSQIELLERDEYFPLKYDRSSYVELGVGNAYDEGGSALFGIHYHNSNRKYKYDKRTTSDIVIGMGMNNTIREGESLGKSPYYFAGSASYELGIAFRTRVFKKTNHMRLVYGLSFLFNTLSIRDNKHFVDKGDQTVLENTGLDLKESKARFDYLVVPFHLEFGHRTRLSIKIISATISIINSNTELADLWE
ncbi:hypothetical protein [Flavobacterium sp. 3HN19-14]|uniref:hypothetical protein n=1 Tax=Flavobacterium sp. 3HN19-14 TaxID=3448133 RepID=UPI003EE2AED1